LTSVTNVRCVFIETAQVLAHYTGYIQHISEEVKSFYNHKNQTTIYLAWK